MNTVSGSPSKLARHALVQGALAIVLPIIGWIAFAIGASVEVPDAAVVGTGLAVLLGALGFLAAITGFALSIVELHRAGNARSRAPGMIALGLALFAPLTWLGEWAIATLIFVSSLPKHIL